MNNKDQKTDPAKLHGSSQEQALARSRQALERSVADLPGNITERLAIARRGALNAAGKPANVARWQINSRYGWGMAASVLVVISLVWLSGSPSQPGQKQVVADSPAESPIESPAVAGQSISPGSLATLTAASAAEDLLTAIELAQLDPESAALFEDMEFLFWLSLDDNPQDEDV